MRLTEAQRQSIKSTVTKVIGEASRVWLFGSRVDDAKRGGDIDFYVETSPHPLMDEVRCKQYLEEALDTPVDLIVRRPGDNSPIAVIARTEGIAL